MEEERARFTASQGRAAAAGEDDGILDLDVLIGQTSANIPKAARTSRPRHNGTPGSPAEREHRKDRKLVNPNA